MAQTKKLTSHQLHVQSQVRIWELTIDDLLNDVKNERTRRLQRFNKLEAITYCKVKIHEIRRRSNNIIMNWDRSTKNLLISFVRDGNIVRSWRVG